MLAILNSLNAHNFPIFPSILMILVSKFMVHRALSDKTYLSFGLLSPLKLVTSLYSKRVTTLLVNIIVNTECQHSLHSAARLYTRVPE